MSLAPHLLKDVSCGRRLPLFADSRATLIRPFNILVFEPVHTGRDQTGNMALGIGGKVVEVPSPCVVKDVPRRNQVPMDLFPRQFVVRFWTGAVEQVVAKAPVVMRISFEDHEPEELLEIEALESAVQEYVDSPRRGDGKSLLA